ncbi:ornithine carbamoyltransferase [Desulfothermobacter acidiphilus]|uniref:ornithine carbamoyltransferase n=1 Tax=Desulfothermobacter acidiphilus TaxID=1938353 RepID=UPI003F8B6F6A
MYASLRKRFRRRDFLSMADFDREEIEGLLLFAAELKEAKKRGEAHTFCAGKSLAMIFQKPSTRTRVSFEVAMFDLGGYALYLNAHDLQLGRGESLEDTGRVLSRYVDGCVIRTYRQEELEEFAQVATVPVINGLTDWEHPCQILADFLTIWQSKGRLAGLKLAYVGDGNNICHSLLLGCPQVGISIHVATPARYAPHPLVVERAKKLAKDTEVEVGEDPVQAVKGADVVVTDVWVSMGQEDEAELKRTVFAPYQVNAALVAHARPDYIFLHCLPAHRGEEVAAEVIDGPHSLVWEEAENRLHAQKALLSLLL